MVQPMSELGSKAIFFDRDGTLIIDNEKEGDRKNLSILIATAGPVVNGWSGWDMMEAITGSIQDKGVTVKVTAPQPSPQPTSASGNPLPQPSQVPASQQPQQPSEE